MSLTWVSLLSVMTKKWALKNSFMLEIDSKVREYEDKFKELKMAFHDWVYIQTGITVSDFFDNIESLSE